MTCNGTQYLKSCPHTSKPIPKIQQRSRCHTPIATIFRALGKCTMTVFRRNTSWILLFLCIVFLPQEVRCQRAIVSLGKRLQNRFGRSQQKRPVASTAGENDASGRPNWSYIAAAVVFAVLSGGHFSYRRRRAVDTLGSNDGEFDSPKLFSTWSRLHFNEFSNSYSLFIFL